MILHNKSKVHTKMEHDNIYSEFFLMIPFHLEVTFNLQDH